MAEVTAELVFVGLCVWCLLSVVLATLRLPGTWMIVAGALLYGWWADWEGVPVWLIVVQVLAAIAGEIIEIVTSVMTARKAGASKQAAWGGFLGAIAGMLLFSIPVPILGTVAGALLGCFAGATVAEWYVRGKLDQGARVGLFSALGFVLGMVTKMALAMAMSGLLLASVFLAEPGARGTAGESETPVTGARETASPVE